MTKGQPKIPDLIINGADRHREPAEKVCDHCHDSLPLDAHHFDRDNKSPDGFKPVCKQCRSEIRRVEDQSEILDRVKELDKSSIRMIDRLRVEDIRSVPHIATLYEDMMYVFGGSQGFARHYFANFLAASPGSSTRQKLLDGVLRLGQKVTESGATKIPVHLLEDEDLEREAGNLLLKLHREDDEPDSGPAAGPAESSAAGAGDDILDELDDFDQEGRNARAS